MSATLPQIPICPLPQGPDPSFSDPCLDSSPPPLTHLLPPSQTHDPSPAPVYTHWCVRRHTEARRAAPSCCPVVLPRRAVASPYCNSMMGQDNGAAHCTSMCLHAETNGCTQGEGRDQGQSGRDHAKAGGTPPPMGQLYRPGVCRAGNGSWSWLLRRCECVPSLTPASLTQGTWSWCCECVPSLTPASLTQGTWSWSWECVPSLTPASLTQGTWSLPCTCVHALARSLLSPRGPGRGPGSVFPA